MARLGARLRPRWRGLAICFAYVVAAFWLTHGLWPDPATRALGLNPEDQTLIEWFLANDVRVLVGDFCLVTDRLNAPAGVNLMVNATIIVLGVLFAPVTLLFGAPVSFALLAAGNLAATAVAWYLLLRRTLGASRCAAASAARSAGFAPGMISQANSHLHMTAQWLVPAMVWCVIRMARAADRDRPEGGPGATRRIVVAALLLALSWCSRCSSARRSLFLAAADVGAVLPGVRGWPGRAGPGGCCRGSRRGLLVASGPPAPCSPTRCGSSSRDRRACPTACSARDYFSADLASFTAISPLSVAGTEEAARLSTGAAEYNTFLGWPLSLVVVGCVVWLFRRPAGPRRARSPAVVMACVVARPERRINGARTEIWGPYACCAACRSSTARCRCGSRWPLIPLIATILVVAVDTGAAAAAAGRLAGAGRGRRRAAADRAEAAAATTTGRRCRSSSPAATGATASHAGGVLVPVPLPTPEGARARCAGRQRPTPAFAIPEGFFIGPYGPDGKASMGTYKQPTSALLAEVAASGTVPAVSQAQRDQAAKDIAFWDASCVVLANDEPNAGPLRDTVDLLFGPGRERQRRVGLEALIRRASRRPLGRTGRTAAGPALDPAQHRHEEPVEHAQQCAVARAAAQQLDHQRPADQPDRVDVAQLQRSQAGRAQRGLHRGQPVPRWWPISRSKLLIANSNAGTTSTIRPPGSTSRAKSRSASTSSSMCSSTLSATTAECEALSRIGTLSSRTVIDSWSS